MLPGGRAVVTAACQGRRKPVPTGEHPIPVTGGGSKA